MDEIQMEQTLRSVGKACFVNYFMMFADPSLQDETVARNLSEREGWSEASALNWRVRGARRIIAAGRAKDALIVIADSRRLPAKTRDRAVSLLKRLSP